MFRARLGYTTQNILSGRSKSLKSAGEPHSHRDDLPVACFISFIAMFLVKEKGK